MDPDYEDQAHPEQSYAVSEINAIEKSFLVTLTGLMHERIRYPALEAMS